MLFSVSILSPQSLARNTETVKWGRYEDFSNMWNSILRAGFRHWQAYLLRKTIEKWLCG